MSALPPKTDVIERDWHVRFVPKSGHQPLYLITSSARRRAEAIGTDAAAGRCARRNERICRTASGIRSFGFAFGARIAASIATA